MSISILSFVNTFPRLELYIDRCAFESEELTNFILYIAHTGKVKMRSIVH